MSNTVSDEILNAYLDNELDDKDTRFVDLQIKNTPELQRQIKQLQDLKLKIRGSYASVSSPLRQTPRTTQKKHLIRTGLAASVTLAIGLATGWFSHGHLNTMSLGADQLLGVKLENLSPEDDKIIIHLSQNDVVLFDQALTKAENILARFDALDQHGKVHVLANSYGMDLLRKEKTPYQARIVNMMQTYDNVEFVACKNTLKRLKSSGKNTSLLSGVKVHGPVINEIIDRMQNGWSYIKI